MFIITDKNFIKEYTRFSDLDKGIKNFRLYYKEKQTNLIWYDGKIIYLPHECFELRNLINIDLNKRYKCAVYASEMKLIQELKKKNIRFILEDNLGELIRRLEASGGVGLNDEVGIELIDDNDYTKIIEPIYLGHGTWLNIDK